jgi:hypothetical protein
VSIRSQQELEEELAALRTPPAGLDGWADLSEAMGTVQSHRIRAEKAEADLATARRERDTALQAAKQEHKTWFEAARFQAEEREKVTQLLAASESVSLGYRDELRVAEQERDDLRARLKKAEEQRNRFGNEVESLKVSIVDARAMGRDEAFAAVEREAKKCWLEYEFEIVTATIAKARAAPAASGEKTSETSGNAERSADQRTSGSESDPSGPRASPAATVSGDSAAREGERPAPDVYEDKQVRCGECDGSGNYHQRDRARPGIFREIPCRACFRGWKTIQVKRAEPAPPPAGPAPIPMRLPCPSCGALHLDVGEFATKVHHTHSCQACGMTWRPAVVATVGVDFLPGFRNDVSIPTLEEAEAELVEAYGSKEKADEAVGRVLSGITNARLSALEKRLAALEPGGANDALVRLRAHAHPDSNTAAWLDCAVAAAKKEKGNG